LFALAALPACTGIFQRAQPDVPARFARSAAGGELRVGSAERDITPTGSVYMGGFDLGRTSTGAASPLKVRAIVFALSDLRVCVIGIDNLGLMRDDVDWIKSRLTGFANGNVFVCASHSHAAPDLIGLWGWYLLTSGRDRSYLAQVGAATAAAVAEAWQRAVPAVLVQATAQLPPRGLVRNTRRSGAFDRRFQVLQARALDDGRPVGTLLHLACHPEVLRRVNTLLSADFVGELCDSWRELGQGQAVFCNGALGAMVTPDVKQRDPEGMQAMGRTLAELGVKALADGQRLDVDAIEVRRQDVYLPLRTLGLTLAELTLAIQRQMYGGCMRSTVGWLRIGPFEAVAVPGEMEPALAQRIRDRAGKPDLAVFGLCDDELGYLLRLQDARDPAYSYERSMCPCGDAGERVQAALLR
jgi:hypothetical protein